MVSSQPDLGRVALLDTWTEHEPPGRYRVDDQTWHDLGLDEVFDELDATRSVVGSQYLYYLLRRPALEPGPLSQLSQRVEALAAEPQTQRWLAARFKALPKRIGWMLPELLYGPVVPVPFPRALLTALPLAMFGSAALGWLYYSPAYLLCALCFAASIFVHYHFTKVAGAQMSSLIYLRSLLILARDIVRKAPPGLEDVRARLQELVPPTAPIIRATWTLGIQDPFELTTYVRVVTLVEAKGYADSLSIIANQRAGLQQLHALLGELDTLDLISSLRDDSGYSIPQFEAGDAALSLTGIRHPCLPEARPNTLELGARGVLLTGLNMSGKSTLLRTVGVNVILAQTLHTTRADHYRGPYLRVMSAIDVHDDLLAGRSYYQSEVRSVGRLVEASASLGPHLFLLDEIFRGTNSIERVAAACSVLTHLAAGGGHVLAATHDMELCGLVTSHYDNFHFGDRVGGDTMSFDYTLRPGPCPTTNAIALLEAAGFPSSIVARSRELIEAKIADGR